MVYIWLILLILMLSWREVQILIDRGSWAGTSRIPLWYINQNSKEKILWVFPKKNFDSFHVSNGLATLIIIEMIIDYLPQIGLRHLVGHFVQVQLHVIAYWLIWMQIRNLFIKANYRKNNV